MLVCGTRPPALDVSKVRRCHLSIPLKLWIKGAIRRGTQGHFTTLLVLEYLAVNSRKHQGKFLVRLACYPRYATYARCVWLVFPVVQGSEYTHQDFEKFQAFICT